MRTWARTLPSLHLELPTPLVRNAWSYAAIPDRACVDRFPLGRLEFVRLPTVTFGVTEPVASSAMDRGATTVATPVRVGDGTGNLARVCCAALVVVVVVLLPRSSPPPLRRRV